MLDMDTGGGENLLSLQEHWPARVVATEDYAPNVKLAAERLSSLGVQVVNVSVSDIEPTPFADGEYNLILNRHAPFNFCEEVEFWLLSNGTGSNIASNCSGPRTSGNGWND